MREGPLPGDRDSTAGPGKRALDVKCYSSSALPPAAAIFALAEAE